MITSTSIRKLVLEWIYIPPLVIHPNARLTSSDGAATASGVFLGDNESSPSATGVEIYANPQNLPTAVASILNTVQNRADFHPATDTPEQLDANFSNYVLQIDNTPFFHLDFHDVVSQTFYSQDYNLLIDQIVSLYVGLSEEDLEEITQAIEAMGNSVFGQEESEIWRNTFAQSSIDYSDPAQPEIYLYSTTLKMHHSKDGKAEVNEQSYSVSRTRYIILDQLIQAYATELATLDKTTVNQWLAEANSPQQTKNNVNQLCFKKARK